MQDAFHVLIVDDDPEDREFLAGAFTKLLPGTRISALENGQKALDLLLQDPAPADCPDVVFLDMHMPGLSGYEVLAALRTAAHCAGLTVMVLSTSALPSVAEACRQAGCTEYFAKPMSLEDYDAIVAATMTHFKKKVR